MANSIGRVCVRVDRLLSFSHRDTNGDTSSYPMTALLDFDDQDIGGRHTAAQLDRTHDELNRYRQRIDANVEQQREQSETIVAMQNKVLEYMSLYVI